jgi:hypothetical protein
MFGFKKRREDREQFRLLQMEIERLHDKIRVLEGKDVRVQLDSFGYFGLELFSYNDLREKYRSHTKEFNL